MIRSNSFIKLFGLRDQASGLNWDTVYAELDRVEQRLQADKLAWKDTQAYDDAIADIYHMRAVLDAGNLQKIVEKCDDTISKREKIYQQRGYDLWESHFKNQSLADTCRERYRHPPRPDVTRWMRGRIGIHAMWEWPGLELGVGTSPWSKRLVGMDPLYLVDQHQELLQKAQTMFAKDYQRRLRLHKMDGEANFEGLPEEQFGFIVSWRWFEQRPLDVIKDYMVGFDKLLRPGGAVLMSFNNCEKHQQLVDTTMRIRAYNTRSWMTALIEGWGYTITAEYDDENTSLVEFTKPGERTSIRGGQTLGQIIHKNDIDLVP